MHNNSVLHFGQEIQTSNSRKTRKQKTKKFGRFRIIQYLCKTMNKLIQTIQEQIDLVMNSKMAKKSDALLLKYEKTSCDPILVNKAIVDYENGLSLESVSKKYNIPSSTISKKFKERKIQMRARVRDSFYYEGKIQDIKNGMGVKEYCEKYNHDRSSYYKFRRKVKKDLADSK